MNRYTLAKAAVVDLREIDRYIAERNPSAADRVMDSLFTAFQRLSAHPYLGEKRDDLRAAIRCFSVHNYAVFYFPNPSGVCIVRVLHGARDIDGIFRESDT